MKNSAKSLICNGMLNSQGVTTHAAVTSAEYASMKQSRGNAHFPVLLISSNGVMQAVTT